MTDEDTVLVRVVGRQFRHEGKQYHRGDELEVPERAIEGWEARLERVEEAAETEEEAVDEAEESTEIDVADIDPHPSELTVDELQERVEGVDDVEKLEAIRQLEAGDDGGRTTALDAIDERLDELEG